MISTKPICLLGFMGSGKSRWGKQLANRLNRGHIDLDRYIEAKAGMTVTELFQHTGEGNFRKLESECLREVLEQNDLVVSLGGGTPCREENIKLLKEKATTVYLKSNAGMLYSRLIVNYKSRPLLANKQPEALLPFIENLLKEREPFYSKADVIVDVEGLTIDKLAKAIESFSG